MMCSPKSSHLVVWDFEVFLWGPSQKSSHPDIAKRSSEAAVWFSQGMLLCAAQHAAVLPNLVQERCREMVCCFSLPIKRQLKVQI